jgi:hypothetical protein
MQVDVKAISHPSNAPHAGFGILAQILAGRQKRRYSFPVISGAPEARLRGLNNIRHILHNKVSDPL